MKKICNKCGIEKDILEFKANYNLKTSLNYSVTKQNKQAYDGIVYSNTCKQCIAEQMKEYRKSLPEGWWKKYRNPNYKGKLTKVPKEEKLLMSAIRQKISEARSNNKRTPEREFNIEDDYMFSLWKAQEGKCYLTGVSLVVEKKKPNSLSIDKLIPEKGYVKGNVLWCAWAANRAKGDLSIQQFLAMSKRILERATTIEKVVEETQQELSRVDSSESKSVAPSKCCS